MPKNEIHPTYQRIVQDKQATQREEHKRMKRFDKLTNEQKQQITKSPALSTGAEKSAKTLDALTAHGAGRLYGHR
jgi:hypothetical protein